MSELIDPDGESPLYTGTAINRDRVLEKDSARTMEVVITTTKSVQVERLGRTRRVSQCWTKDGLLLFEAIEPDFSSLNRGVFAERRCRPSRN